MSEPRFTSYRVGGVDLHTAVAGPVDGPLVVLLHGFPEHWRGWRHQIGPLAAAGFRVLAPDQRGYNLSGKPRWVWSYRPRRLVGDVVELIEAAGHRSACVAGHDWGALVAWWLAAWHPDRVRRLAILNVPHPRVARRWVLWNREQRRRSHYVFKFQVPWLPERRIRRDGFAAAMRNVQGTARPGSFDDEEMARYREAWARPGALRSMVHWYRAGVRFSLLGRIGGRIRPPTLILWGARDPFLGRDMVAPSLELCDDGRVEWLEDATHWLQHEEPDRVSRSLVRFFS